MLQTTQGHQIIQTATGQQIVVQSLPAGQQIQVVNSSSNENNGLQQVQVLPVQTTAGGQPIMLQQSSTPHVIQTADGQTLIYQPVQMQDGAQVVQPQAIQAGGQVIQLGTPTVFCGLSSAANSLNDVYNGNIRKFGRKSKHYNDGTRGNWRNTYHTTNSFTRNA